METTMGKQCSILWTASRTIAIVGIFVASFHGNAQTHRITSLKGVVHSNHRGFTGNSVGTVGLAVGDRVYELDYGVRFIKFKNPVCWHVGAVWSVRVRDLSGLSGNLVSAQCTGQVDENVHGPQQAALEYLDLVSKGELLRSQNLLTSRWRSSTEFEEYEVKLRDFDLSDYRLFGQVISGCLDVVSVDRPDRTELRGEIDCAFKLRGEPVDISFVVVRDADSGRWEIDDIRLTVPPRIEFGDRRQKPPK